MSVRIRAEQARRKRRQQQGRAAPSRLVKLNATQAERDSFTKTHALFLKDLDTLIVDFCLVRRYDDSVVRAAIVAVVHQVPPSSEPAQELLEELSRLREQSQCAEETLVEGLRVIYRSLSNVSKCKSGEITYLTHTRRFLNTGEATPPNAAGTSTSEALTN